MSKPATSRTLGFRPTCKCGTGEVRPCIVLDPFCGSGSTGVAALRAGRSFVGIELNPQYAADAAERIKYYWRRPARPRSEPEQAQLRLGVAP